MTEEPAGRQGIWLFLCFLLLSCGLWATYLDTPFSRVLGFADYISNENGRIAENHLRYGLSATKGDQIRNLEKARTAEWVHYNNHPATLDLLTAGVIWLTGSTTPGVKRLLSLLATLASLVLLAALARREGISPWLAMAIFLVLPLTLIHGLNLSYEPLAIFWMLGLVLLRERGWHWSLLPVLWLGGLIDFPVLYLGPWFALRTLWEVRWGESRRSLVPALLYSLALALTCIASLGAHLLHVAWTMGGLQANSGQSWWDHVLLSLNSRGSAPALLPFLESQMGFFWASFTVPVLILALLSFWPRPIKLLGLLGGRRPGPAALAFLFAGTLHLGLFRSHAMVHDFWLAYFAPFFALAGATLLARLSQFRVVIVLVLTACLGFWSAISTWQERALVPVRKVAADLGSLFDSDVVLHSLLAPPGWALESYRGHPVMDAADLLQQPFSQYLDRLGSLGYLSRPQRLFVPISALKATWARDLNAKVLPEALVVDKSGQTEAYRIYDLGPFLLDPGRSPFLMDKSILLPGMAQRISEAERQRLIDRARKFLVLRLFEPGSEIGYLDGRSGPYENILGRRVRSVSVGELGLGSTEALVAWPGTRLAQQLRALHGDAVRSVSIQAAGEPASVWVWRPQK